MSYFHTNLMVPNISIIIPAHNEEKYIRKTLHSLSQQTYQDYEAIVVANGCTDKTEQIVRKRSGKRISLYSLGAANVSKARNHGAERASGNILVFLDADTVLHGNALHTIHQNFLDHHAVATTKVRPDLKGIGYKTLMGLKNFHNKTKIYEGCGGILICRKSDFDSVNGYDTSIIVKEHRKLTLKLMKLGGYACLNTFVTTSMRRFENWGVAKAGVFWVKQWVKDKVGNLGNSDYERVR